MEELQVFLFVWGFFCVCMKVSSVSICELQVSVGRPNTCISL